MVRPRNRGERRKRNNLAKELADRKYHQRVIQPYKREKWTYDTAEEHDSEERWVQDNEQGARQRGLDYLPPYDVTD